MSDQSIRPTPAEWRACMRQQEREDQQRRDGTYRETSAERAVRERRQRGSER